MDCFILLHSFLAWKFAAVPKRAPGAASMNALRIVARRSLRHTGPSLRSCATVPYQGRCSDICGFVWRKSQHWEDHADKSSQRSTERSAHACAGGFVREAFASFKERWSSKCHYFVHVGRFGEMHQTWRMLFGRTSWRVCQHVIDQSGCKGQYRLVVPTNRGMSTRSH